MTYTRKWNEVELMFKEKGFEGGNPNILILAKKHASEFVEECKRKKIPILGIDGFFVGKDIKPIEGFTITKKSVQPSQEDSVDFSWEPYKYKDFTLDEIYDKAAEFIKERPDNVYFEIVCGNGNEEQS